MKFALETIAAAVLASSSVASAFVVSPSQQQRVSVSSPSKLSVATEKTKALFVDETRASVSNYYGKELSSSDDLKTNACCTAGAPPQYIQDCIKNIHPEVVSKYYGCGLCLPQYPLTGAKVLDLGSGSGRDVYIASQLVGPTGKVCKQMGTIEARTTRTLHKSSLE
jgi:arsenite methyltransferase